MAPAGVTIVGGGIIGISTGLALLRAGLHPVRVLDRQAPGKRASEGNAGAFAFTDIEPLATPGILRRAPGWLLDPMGPLAIPPRYALRIAPWLWRFWRASRPERYDAAVAAQSSLMTLARAALERQIADTQGAALMRREGQLQLYEGARQFQASLPAWDQRRAHGIRFDLLETPAAIAEIQPGLAPRFTHAGFTPDWLNVTAPEAWLAHLTQNFLRGGGTIEQALIGRIEPHRDHVTLHTEDGRRLDAGQVVVAAGAWSHRLAQTLGDRLPLETERGYNTTLPDSTFDLRTHLTFADHGFVVSRNGAGIRVGGAVELGGLDLPPHPRRADHLLQKAARFLPGLKTEGGTPWMGFRPSLPDSLPVIDHATRTNRVIYAFGHGHLGLTQSAATAELVRALILSEKPPVDLAPFSAKRFSRRP